MPDVSINSCENCRMQQRFMTIVCIFTCVFAFSCCVYCTWTVQMSLCPDKTEGYITSERKTTAKLTSVKFYARNLPDTETMAHERKTRSSANKKTRHRVKKTRSRAAHYITDVFTHYQQLPAYKDTKISGTCEDIPALDGKLCRDESFTPNSNQLNIFKEASWVNARKSPFKKLKSGIFEARYSGIYLVYGQLLALDDGDSRNISLIQTRKSEEIQRVMCFESFKINDKSLRFKTCGITALFAARKKDRFVIQNFSSNSKLSLREGANYIGAIVLK